jgi:hypothetical protein
MESKKDGRWMVLIEVGESGSDDNKSDTIDGASADGVEKMVPWGVEEVVQVSVRLVLHGRSEIRRRSSGSVLPGAYSRERIRRRGSEWGLGRS